MDSNQKNEPLINTRSSDSERFIIPLSPGSTQQERQVSPQQAAQKQTLSPHASMLPPPHCKAAIPIVHQRHLNINGTQNFRDLGGYVTADGKHQVRWNRLYRSDNLSKIPRTLEMYDLLHDELGITCIIDLRSSEERNRSPYSLGVMMARKIPISITDDAFRPVFEAPELTEEIAEACMVHLFDMLVNDFINELSQFFRVIVDRGIAHPNEAVLFHCKAGKDRTGFLSALLLIALGVPMSTVFDDFMLSNTCFRPPPLNRVQFALRERKVEKRAVSALFSTRRSYLQHAFDTIEKQWGDVPTYMRTALNVSDEDMEKLRRAYLEPRRA